MEAITDLLFLAVCSEGLLIHVLPVSDNSVVNDMRSLGYFWAYSAFMDILCCAFYVGDEPPLMQVLLGYPYTVAIDMWSLGCMAAELFLGLPLFPGASEHDLLVRIVEMRGVPPDHVLAKAQHTKKYFERVEELSMVSGTPISTLRYKVGAQACST